MNTKKDIFITSAWVCIILFSAGWSPVANASSPQIVFENNKLLIDVKDVRLDYIFSRVAEETDLRIIFYGPAHDLVTMKMDFTPLEKALKRLLAGSAFSFIYEKEKNTLGELLPVLKEIIIIPEKMGDETIYSNYKKEDVTSQTDIAATSEAMEVVGQSTSEDSVPGANTYGKGVFVKLEPQMSNRLAVQELFSGSNSTATELNSVIGNETEAREEPFGLRIRSVEKGSGFESLGLKQGDVIRQINGQPVSDPSKAETIVQQTLANNEETIIRMEVERGEVIEPIYIELN